MWHTIEGLAKVSNYVLHLFHSSKLRVDDENKQVYVVVAKLMYLSGSHIDVV